MWKLYSLMCPSEDGSRWTSPGQEGFWFRGTCDPWGGKGRPLAVF